MHFMRLVGSALCPGSGFLAPTLPHAAQVGVSYFCKSRFLFCGGAASGRVNLVIRCKRYSRLGCVCCLQVCDFPRSCGNCIRLMPPGGPLDTVVRGVFLPRAPLDILLVLRGATESTGRKRSRSRRSVHFPLFVHVCVHVFIVVFAQFDT